MISIHQANTTEDYKIALALIDEYAESLGIDLCFQDFENERVNLKDKYGDPDGCLLIAEYQNRPVGCAALQKRSDEICEMKRMYVKPEYRRKKIGRKLTELMIRIAREIGYRKIYLDTLVQMDAAQALYHTLGFHEIDPYYENPYPGARYMELELL